MNKKSVILIAEDAPILTMTDKASEIDRYGQMRVKNRLTGRDRKEIDL